MPLADRSPALLRLVQRLEARADDDPDFRALLLDLADTLIDLAGPDLLEDVTSGESSEPAAPEHVQRGRGEPAGDQTPGDGSLLDLAAHFRDGEHVGHAESGTTDSIPFASDSELDPRLADRFALKADAAQFAAGRMQLGRDHRGAGEALDLDRNLLLARAERHRHCALWMLSEPLRSTAAAETLARAYASAASAVRLLVAFGDAEPVSGSPHAAALVAGAEAQSALRAAVAEARAASADSDPDQAALFRAIRSAIGGTDVYIDRYLRLDDPADPRRLDALDARLAHQHGQRPTPTRGPENDGATPPPADLSGRRDKLLKAVTDRAGRVERGVGSPGTNWPRLLDDLAKAVRAGVAESAVELRDALLPILDTWPTDAEAPAEAPAEAARVRREIERYVASRPDENDDAEDDPFSPEVAAVAARLGGHTVALFGGVPKPHVAERIERAFGVRVHWEQTRAHQSTEPFRAAVAQPDLALAILFIRWCSHSFEDLKAYCEAAGVPYVRVKAGNHPNRLARAILAQVGERTAV